VTGNLLIAMSGGTTTVINATLAGIVSRAQSVGHWKHIYAGIPGIQGVMEERFVDLSVMSPNDLHRLRRTPGSATIGTTRVATLDSNDLELFKRVLDKWDIQSFVNIGGNGTIKQTRTISDYSEGTLQVSGSVIYAGLSQLRQLLGASNRVAGDREYGRVFARPSSGRADVRSRNRILGRLGEGRRPGEKYPSRVASSGRRATIGLRYRGN